MEDAERVTGIREAIARGEYLLAYDEATAALEASPEDLVLQRADQVTPRFSTCIGKVP